MANIKDLKKKIKATKGTFKITKAMKLVSAAKMARAQLAISNARPYSRELDVTIKTVSALVQNYSHTFFSKTNTKRAILLVVSSDKGLCGGYNSQLGKAVKKFLRETELDLKVYYIGKKVRDIIAKEVNEGKTFKFKKNEPSFVEIKAVAQELAEAFSNGEVGSVYVAYNVFKSAIAFDPTVAQLLPMELATNVKEELAQKHPFDFKYEPKAPEILDALIPQSYVSTFYTCILDALAAEHGSRMAAMDSANNNCKAAIKTLTLKMNKLRQASITKELIEVVTGAESLKG
jgi:F-type H+-transporting ATPase subunit gamma